ncbi:hypothetical protein K438DRAFT_2154584 [Mycena galopus ATCC 62051]|nr:hypothetical protein K438DRAFT_2154584 [Mycena galopus ATCC 62051]
MSSSLKRPTSSRPVDNADSDEDVVSAPVASTSPRYNFRYPRLSTTVLPAFQDHPFWHSFGNGPGRTLIIFALRIRTNGHGIIKNALVAALCDGLPYFCLAVTSLDPDKTIPKDITLCLAGIYTLSQLTSDFDDEWTEFIFPDLSDDPPPRHPNDVEPPPTSRNPTADELEAAPHLAKTTLAPPPVQKHRRVSTPRTEVKVEPPKDGPPSKRSRNTEVEAQPALAADTPACKTRSADKPTPSKVVVPRTPGPENPSKTVAKLLKTLPTIETKLKEIGDSKHEIGWAAFPADDFIITVAVSRKQGTTIPHTRSHVGVTSTHCKSKATNDIMAPLEPMPLVELEAVRNLPVKNAVEPLIGCTPCNLLCIKCQPNGVGVTCQSCSYKKMGTICNHTMDTAQFVALMHDHVEKATFFFPTILISVECLKHAADMVAAARKSFVLVHGEFCLHLHTFICVIRNQGDVLRKEGFRTLFKDLKEDEDVAAAFNTLIGHYNTTLAKPSKVFEVGDEEDAVGELDVPTLKADPGGSLVPYDSDDNVEVSQKPAVRSLTKVFQKQAPSTSG